MSSTLSAGLTGCGFFAANHLHAWRDIDRVEVAAVCGRDLARLAAVGDQSGITRRSTAGTSERRSGRMTCRAGRARTP